MADEDDRVIQQHNQEDIEKFQYGCEHYRSNPKDRHELARHDVSQVICEVCDEEQKVAHICSKCGVKMGEYFCEVCKFYDDDVLPIHYKQTSTILRSLGTSKFKRQMVATENSGINFSYSLYNVPLHYVKCISTETTSCQSLGKGKSTASCYAVGLRDNHSCVENSMKNHCPICYEYLFDSVQSAQVLKCGHTIHENCFTEMVEQNQYRCPICYKSAHNMSATWEILNEEIEATEMPEEYRYEVPILCNDCHTTSKAFFHILGHKCSHCNSYNTRIVGAPDHPPRPYQADHNS